MKYIIGLCLMCFYSLSYAGETAPIVVSEKPVRLSLSSPAFNQEGMIPTDYTCDGKRSSPPLVINGVSKKAQSLILVAVDKESSTPPDQAVIWFIYNIPPQTKTIASNQTPAFSTVGRNNDGSHSYQSPCPTEGTHHYYFVLYAVNTVLPETVTSLQDAADLMKNHMVGYASLMGTYARK